jgi:hypothetical protein
VRERARQHVERDLHLPADEIGDHGRSAAIGDVDHVGAGHHFLGVGDEFGDCLRRKRRVCHHHQRKIDQAGDRRDVSQQVERKVVEQRHVDRGGRRNEQQRVAVGRRVDHGLDGDIAAGPRLVFDHDRLAESLRQPRGHDPRDDIGPAAGRKSDDPAQRPRRIGLRAGATRRGGKRTAGAREM